MKRQILLLHGQDITVPRYEEEYRFIRRVNPRELYEILIVDNGSDDGTADVVRSYPVKLLVENGKRNSYAARNRGIANAIGEVIAFTDADCIPRNDWIESGVTNLNRVPRCGLVGGRIVFFFKNSGKPNAVEIYDSILGLRQKEHIENGKYGATANVFTFKKVFKHAGLFDDTLKSGGDNKWGRRVHSFGYELVYADDIVVAHPARHSLGQLYRRLSRLVGGNYSEQAMGK